ncbi:hypothetical protein LEP1GSC074_3102 [Leptospira noguchii str. Hook]|uniref:Uncharacterized protein n=1 Tax=Leptospira noguchii serovar Autumnalis str. ZUN142 TaxID=1085540 RepID=M6UPC0_9LEPT|nr:hypothetical protein LEP1GSC186_0298 [Leptospira noguchii serovar Autumnalis str. ZUN142]EMS88550.1 hypothetical protein LEP1GSC074_3102 [Leptospira noguchii str. Hook]
MNLEKDFVFNRFSICSSELKARSGERRIRPIFYVEFTFKSE